MCEVGLGPERVLNVQLFVGVVLTQIPIVEFVGLSVDDGITLCALDCGFLVAVCVCVGFQYFSDEEFRFILGVGTCVQSLVGVVVVGVDTPEDIGGGERILEE